MLKIENTKHELLIDCLILVFIIMNLRKGLFSPLRKQKRKRAQSYFIYITSTYMMIMMIDTLLKCIYIYIQKWVCMHLIKTHTNVILITKNQLLNFIVEIEI